MTVTDDQIQAFRATLLGYYDQHARHELPWRQPNDNGVFNPYHIWVSELMLQQTQVNRVIPKYQQFLQTFPTVQSLAAAQLGDVLIAWQGLGYNRRAKFLWQAANQIVTAHNGQVPGTLHELTALPGIGTNTAGAILAYAFNQPAIFIETNVRTVYFHHFFIGAHEVSDKQITEVLTQTLEQQNPREFYWALMDYGSYLKQQGKGSIARSKHYTKQSKFEGSPRQIRGRILRVLAARPHSQTELLDILHDDRALGILGQLQNEGMIRLDQHRYYLA